MATPTVTLGDVRTIQYKVLREAEDDTSYDATLLDLFTNIAQEKFCEGRIIHPITKEEAKKGTLSFLNKDAFYEVVSGTGLTAAASTGDSTLTVTSSTDFPASGVLYIQGEIIPYSSKASSTNFTLTGTVVGNFSVGAKVEIAYAVPSDYMGNIGMVLNHQVKLPFKVYDDIFEYLNSFKGGIRARNYRSGSMFSDPYQTPPFYSIRDASQLLMYNIGETGDQIRQRYEKLPTTMSDDSDLITIDKDNLGKMYLAYQGLGEMFWNRQEEESGSKYMNVGLSLARELYDYYNKQDTEKMTGKHYGMQKGSGNNF